MTEELVRDWINRSPQEFLTRRPAVQPPEEMLNELSARVRELQRVADAIYHHWLAGVARD
jgi:hypothetical protein